MISMSCLFFTVKEKMIAVESVESMEKLWMNGSSTISIFYLFSAAKEKDDYHG